MLSSTVHPLDEGPKQSDDRADYAPMNFIPVERLESIIVTAKRGARAHEPVRKYRHWVHVMNRMATTWRRSFVPNEAAQLVRRDLKLDRARHHNCGAHRTPCSIRGFALHADDDFHARRAVGKPFRGLGYPFTSRCAMASCLCLQGRLRVLGSTLLMLR